MKDADSEAGAGAGADAGALRRPGRAEDGRHVQELRGRCRCGNVEVRLRTARPPETLPLRACQCSFCREHDARTVTDPAGTAWIGIADAAAVQRHRFALATADFLLCKRCGAYAGAVADDGAGGTRATLNAALFVPALEQAAEPVDYDGESAAARAARRRVAWTPAQVVEVGEVGNGGNAGDAGARAPVAAVRVLFEEYQRWLGLDLCFQGFDHELASLPGDYAPPRGRLLIARAGGRDGGCGALRPLDAEVAEMKRLYVRAPWRGWGVGRLLAQRLVADARALGYARLRLDTLPVMTAAQALYATLGFRDIAPYRPNPIPGARWLELDLTTPRPAAP
ncbi:MAG TPA: GNAT family N-acetyltransferase [Myxococcota bacterium]|jgi:GNAT superfamily N-acetyltransferase|nr:GNAT family N-acetyltransferase [Myxococcota bacterium]